MLLKYVRATEPDGTFQTSVCTVASLLLVAHLIRIRVIQTSRYKYSTHDVTDQAFVTLATNDVYCPGALVLGQSLRNHRTSRRLAVLITPQVSCTMRTALGTIFDSVVDVNEIDSNDSVHLALLKRLELGVTFTKLHCWTLTQYSKCVFMDADTMVLCNVDELFDWEELSAAPDSGWPDCFNSGVFVFQPSLKTFNLLLQYAGEHGSFDGGDQGLLNGFFCNWATKDIKKHLPFIYNLTSNAIYTYAPAFQHFGKDAKVVHFLGPAKPWDHKYNPQEKTAGDDGSASGAQSQLSFLELWWKTYTSSILPLLGKLQESPESKIQREEHNMNGDNGNTFETGTPIVCSSSPISADVEGISEVTVNSPCEKLVRNEAECSLDIHIAEPSKLPAELFVPPVSEHPLKTNDSASHASDLSVQPKAEEMSAENERRKWEEGHIDYLGKDAFENIKKKLDSFLL